MAELKKFSELGLSEQTIDAINRKGFESPTEIQALTIPVMLKRNSNIIAQAQTGTGKTAAFGLPLVDMINVNSRAVQALILAPTRELAIQVSEEINSLKGDKDIVVTPIYGGQSIDQQLRRLKKGSHIVVGTPGRIIDHLRRRTLKLGGIEHLILDEADEMLNMGFIDDMETIMAHTNPDKQTLLFSATMPKKIKDLATKYMDGYEYLAVTKEQITTNLTEQIYFEVKPSDKFEALCRIIDIEETFYGLVFCRTKIDVDRLVHRLGDRGYDSDAIHGDISQAQREKTLKKFKSKHINILVATDVAARGIDVNNLTHVINFALPHDPEAYVHRIGRTGRAGNEGTAITFITPSEYRQLMFIQQRAKADIKKATVPRVKEIITAKRKKIFEELMATMDQEADPAYVKWALRMLEEKTPVEVLAATLKYCFDEQLDEGVYGEVKELNSQKNAMAKQSKEIDSQGKARLFVTLGKKDKLTPRKLINLILQKVSIQSREIRDIEIMDQSSFLTVPFSRSEEIIACFKEKGSKPLFTRAKPKKAKSDRDKPRNASNSKGKYKKDKYSKGKSSAKNQRSKTDSRKKGKAKKK